MFGGTPPLGHTMGKRFILSAEEANCSKLAAGVCRPGSCALWVCGREEGLLLEQQGPEAARDSREEVDISAGPSLHVYPHYVFSFKACPEITLEKHPQVSVIIFGEGEAYANESSSASHPLDLGHNPFPAPAVAVYHHLSEIPTASVLHLEKKTICSITASEQRSL